MPYINGNPVKYTHIRIANKEHFIRSLSAVVDDKMNEYLNNFTTQATQAFANGLKNRLLRNAEPKDENSQRLVQNIADSIRAEILGHRSYIKVPIDDQNLALYLEYGTGLAGFENPHQEFCVFCRFRAFLHPRTLTLLYHRF